MAQTIEQGERLRSQEDFDQEFIAMAERAGLREQIEIKGHRPGGYIDCIVPMELIDNQEVPVKEDHVADIAKNMDRKVKEEGEGTGQDAPIQLALIDGEPTLKIIDGYHRSGALNFRGVEKVYAIVKKTDWEGLFTERVFNAKDHAHVRFSRVVQWVTESWKYSGFQDRITIKQAVLLYGMNTAGTNLGLSEDEADQVKAWVAEKEDAWGVKAMTIHGDLKIAEAVDPKLVHATRERKSGHKLEAPTKNILAQFAEILPNKFGLQNIVMNAAKEHNLQAPFVRTLCLKVDGKTIKQAEGIIASTDWKTLKPSYAKGGERKLRKAYDPKRSGDAVIRAAAANVDDVILRIAQGIEREEATTAEDKLNIELAIRATVKLHKNVGQLLLDLYRLLDAQPPEIEKPPKKLKAKKHQAAPALTQANQQALSQMPKKPVLSDTERDRLDRILLKNLDQDDPIESSPQPVVIDSRQHIGMTAPDPASHRYPVEVEASPRMKSFYTRMSDFLSGTVDHMPVIDGMLEAKWAQRFLRHYEDLGSEDDRERVAVAVDTILGAVV